MERTSRSRWNHYGGGGRTGLSRTPRGSSASPRSSTRSTRSAIDRTPSLAAWPHPRTEDPDIDRCDGRYRRGEFGGPRSRPRPRARMRVPCRRPPGRSIGRARTHPWPSTNREPTADPSPRAASKHPSSTGQSPPITSGKRPSSMIRKTASRTRVIITTRPLGSIRCVDASPPAKASGRLSVSVVEDVDALRKRSTRPASRRTTGGNTTPSSLRLDEFTGTPE